MFLFIRAAAGAWNCSMVVESILAIMFKVVATEEKQYYLCSYCLLRGLTYEKLIPGKHYCGSAVLLVCTVLFHCKCERLHPLVEEK